MLTQRDAERAHHVSRGEKVMRFFPVLALSLFAVSLYARNAWAPLCTMQLEERASVFELDCPDGSPEYPCSIVGYFSDTTTYSGYGGVVATIWSGKHDPAAKTENRDIHNLTTVINTYKNGQTFIEMPLGYWNALKLAIDIKGSGKPQLGNIGLYFDALTGNQVEPPKMTCVEVRK